MHDAAHVTATTAAAITQRRTRCYCGRAHVRRQHSVLKTYAHVRVYIHAPVLRKARRRVCIYTRDDVSENAVVACNATEQRAILQHAVLPARQRAATVYSAVAL